MIIIFIIVFIDLNYMATPRIIVSSTCYDIQEIRFQLKTYIHDYRYESVLSEFDNISLDYEKHIQDSLTNT